MKIVAVIQARMQSTRLPGKILKKLAEKPVLQWVIDAAWAAEGVDDVIVATSEQEADDVVVKYCEDNGHFYIRGSESDVISRFVVAQRATSADALIRLTADCPFHDPAVIGGVIRLFKDGHCDYASNIDPPTWPDGLDVEIFRDTVLYDADENATRKTDRDCVTRYMARNRHTYSAKTLICPIPGLIKERWVLDTENDLKFCEKIADVFGSDMPISYLEILSLLESNPALRKINSMHPRNERFYEGVNTEELGTYKYHASEEQLKAARRVIPLGAQTFSKSYVQFPSKAPYFISHGDGAYCYDIDGNEYVDLVGGLLPIILGHRDPDVDAAIREQLNSGITFSLATTLELELAHRIQRLIPSADMVRFGKNGSDVTSVAVRLARAFTDRPRVISIGYHGWHDTFIGDFGDRGRGVPDAVRNLTYHTEQNEIITIANLLKRRECACIILEPERDINLKAIRQLCDETGTILIFDEIITWPRWGMNGAQHLFGVTPDLTCLSKAMANGMPISAICGRKDIMKLLEPSGTYQVGAAEQSNAVFFSGTFQGEALSIAAAIACIDKLERENVVEKIKERNNYLSGEIFKLAEKYQIGAILDFRHGLTRISFDPSYNATKEQKATLFRQTMAANGVLIISSNNLSYMHRDAEMKRIVRAYELSFQAIKEAIENGDIERKIGGAAVSPGANVRTA